MKTTKTSILRFVTVCLVLVMMLSLLTGCKGGTAAASGGDNAKVAIRISACNSLDHPQTLGLQVMKEYVEKESGGNITVEIFPNSQLGDELSSLEQVRTGTLEMATASFGPLATLAPKMMVMDIPFLFKSYDEAWMVLDSQVGSDLLNELEAVKLKSLGSYENGFRHVTNNKLAINTPADFSGLKIRTMQTPMHILNFKTLGANPTPVPFSELYLAMSQNIVEGQENPLANIWEVKMYEVQKFTSLTGHIYDAMPLVCNLDWYNKLSPEYQGILSKGAILGQNYSRFVNAAREEVLVDKLIEKGMAVNEVSNETKAEMQKISRGVVADAVKEKAGAEFVDNFLAGIDRVLLDVNKGVQ